MKKSIGAYIRICREQRGLTRKELGILCGYSPGSGAESTVCAWEADKQLVPTKRLRAVARALGVPIDTLVP